MSDKDSVDASATECRSTLCTSPKDLQRELERLGEPAADAGEIAAAERLASRLEGALHMAGPAEDGDLSTLAGTLRSSGHHVGKDAGVAAADRALASIFGDTTESQTPADPPADELEQRRAETLAAGVDRMIAGLQPNETPAEVQDLLLLAGLIRASTHATALSLGRLETLVDQAYGAEVPAAATPRDQSSASAPATAPAPATGRSSTLLRLALVAVLSVLVLGGALVMGGYLRPEPSTSARQALPTHLTSRSTRDILPTAFERGQTSTERIDLIYHDRLRSFRELHLGAHQTGRRP